MNEWMRECDIGTEHTQAKEILSWVLPSRGYKIAADKAPPSEADRTSEAMLSSGADDDDIVQCNGVVVGRRKRRAV